MAASVHSGTQCSHLSLHLSLFSFCLSLGSHPWLADVRSAHGLLPAHWASMVLYKLGTWIGNCHIVMHAFHVMFPGPFRMTSFTMIRMVSLKMMLHAQVSHSMMSQAQVSYSWRKWSWVILGKHLTRPARGTSWRRSPSDQHDLHSNSSLTPLLPNPLAWPFDLVTWDWSVQTEIRTHCNLYKAGIPVNHILHEQDINKRLGIC